MIQVAGYSIIGDRDSQQDSMRYEQKNGVLLASVCDGMGGMQGGELASRQAIETIFREAVYLPSERGIPDWLRNTFIKADADVCRLTGPGGEYLNCGTTVVSAVLVENRIDWGSVGDSKIYFFNKGQLRSITRMHNYNLKLDEMVRNGTISQEERIRESHRGEALISFLGLGELPLIDVNTEPLVMESGDMLILCSDGLYKSLDEQQVQAIVEESGENVQIASKRLCEEALRLAVSKQDNTTVIAISCQ